MTGKFSLRDAVVLLTGAGSGIGRQLVDELQRRGAQVAALDVEAAALDELRPRLDSRSMAILADVTDAEAMRQAVADVVRRYGRLDVVIANAGVERLGAAWDASAESFEQVIEVNLLGVYRSIKPALEPIFASGGYILAVSSVASMVPMPLAVSYSASKAGVEMLMRCLRFEMLGSGASCGVAYLGFVGTPMAERVFALGQARAILRRMPTWLLGVKPVQDPAHVARVIADGVERRKARVFAPFMVGVTYLLRGVYSLLDDVFAEYVARIGRTKRGAGG